MSIPLKVAFVDRDGTLVEEPADQQVDRVDKIRLMPDVIPSLLELQRAGFALVMVTNQDGLGTSSMPEADFRQAHDFLLELFASQGVRFEQIFICPHFAADGCECRKPKLGLLKDWLSQHELDRTSSVMIGDRDTDLEFARNLGIIGVRTRRLGSPAESWSAIARRLARPERRAQISRRTRETEVVATLDLGQESPVHIESGIGFFDHMLEQIARHGGFSLELRAKGDLRIDEHHTVEDCALTLGQALRQALGDKRGIGRYGFLLPMDEAQARIALDLSGRPYFVFDGRFNRERVGELPTELVPHFFRSLADSLGAAIHISVHGENSHHMIEACFKGVGRALRQAIHQQGSELPSSKGVL
ncbi:MAG TPA: bifunctional histidinol-phosphatase/imidazoleglycerol-phosphate dehydratase HisB [Steroidobacteraceae bacterium]|nr:bifunctional histidinol-phosphatase/imidazoleglycerol-phosphate dehydratase HisB [Steroidobacteraceae bacterium]